jgi:type III secretion protein T
MDTIIDLFQNNKDALRAFLVGFSIMMLRPTVMFIIIPFLSSGVILGTLQITMTFALILPLAPQFIPLFTEKPPEMTQLLIILFKEALIGAIFGLVMGIPFWIAEGIGFVVDNQRGTSMASVFNPLSGESTSPLGVLLNVTVTALFFASGCFIIFLAIFYGTYLLWPVNSLMPTLDARFINYFLGITDHLFRAIVLYASPMMIMMFLSDMGLGLMNRFAQQLNVFTLSMPIKSALALFVLILYLPILFGFLKDEFTSAFVLLKDAKYLLK